MESNLQDAVTHQYRSQGTEISPPLERREQTMATLLGVWIVVGLFLDGWAHENQKPESFFTVWHGVLYSGFTAATAYAAYQVMKRREPAKSWREAIPDGHGLTLAALATFGAAAVGDFVWHEVFGIELGVEALLSPTHLMLMTSAMVALSAPVRAAWVHGQDVPKFREFMPVALSMALVTSLLMFFLVYLSPFSIDAAGSAFDRVPGQIGEHPSQDLGELQQLLGVASILMTSVVMAIATAALLRRWKTPPGTFTLLYGFVVLLLVGISEFAQPAVLIAGFAAGAVADFLSQHRHTPALVAASSAAVLWLGYFAFYALHEGSTAWSAELWVGSVFLGSLLAGLVGLLVTPLPRSRDLVGLADSTGRLAHD
ncbi:MAG: hypothetical protein ACC652_05265 [Acidimicrobiales bacterium]